MNSLKKRWWIQQNLFQSKTLKGHVPVLLKADCEISCLQSVSKMTNSLRFVMLQVSIQYDCSKVHSSIEKVSSSSNWIYYIEFSELLQIKQFFQKWIPWAQVSFRTFLSGDTLHQKLWFFNFHKVPVNQVVWSKINSTKNLADFGLNLRVFLTMYKAKPHVGISFLRHFFFLDI
jgi:hypothetical protein